MENTFLRIPNDYITRNYVFLQAKYVIFMSKSYDIFSQLMDGKKVRMKDVARATGVAYTSLTDWKSGRSQPKIDKIQKLADYFGVTADYILTGNRSHAQISPDLRFIADAWQVLDENDRNEILALIRIKYDKYRAEEKRA